MRLLATAILVTLAGGCGDGPPRGACNVDALALSDVAGRSYADCTAVALSIDLDGGTLADGMALGQQCVLDAIAQSRPFVLVYDVPHPVNHLRAGVTGVPEGGKFAIWEYVYSGDGDGKAGDAHPIVSTHSCSASGATAALIATPGCVPIAGRPCLTCTRPGVGAIRCGGS